MTKIVRSPQPSQEELCVCGHSWGRHDAIALRYCNATTSGNLVRGCVCAVEPAVAVAAS